MKDSTKKGQNMINILATIQKATGAFMFAKGVTILTKELPKAGYTLTNSVDVALKDKDGNEMTKTETKPVDCLESKHLSYAGEAVVDIFSTFDKMNSVLYPSTDIIVRNNVLSDYTIPAEFNCFMRPDKVVLLAEFKDDDRADDLLMQYEDINDSNVGSVLPPKELNLAFDILVKAINPKCQACYGLAPARREMLHLTKDMVETYPTRISDELTLVHRQTEDICLWVLSYPVLRRRQYSIDSTLNMDEKFLNWARALRILSTKRVVDNTN